jgi:PHD/YefM family antitoxin component YafN of YafNO toxin-antitoxin module
MIRITEAEFQSAINFFSEKAQREPVIITRGGQDYLVLLSADEFMRLKRRDRKG